MHSIRRNPLEHWLAIDKCTFLIWFNEMEALILSQTTQAGGGQCVQSTLKNLRGPDQQDSPVNETRRHETSRDCVMLMPVSGRDLSHSLMASWPDCALGPTINKPHKHYSRECGSKN